MTDHADRPGTARSTGSADGTDGPEPMTWLDERGRRCPLPVIALARAQRAHPPGSLIALMADDPAAETDVAAWCRMRGGTLVRVDPPRDCGPGRTYVVRLPPAASEPPG